MIRLRLFAAAAMIAWAIVACSFTTDLGSLNDGQCPSGTKACNSQCVGVTDPQHNCAVQGSCSPCTLANATATCGPNGVCAVAACNTGYKQCGGDKACDTHVAFDANNCGNCGHVCNLPNANNGCTNGACVVSSCTDGFSDCDENPTNGCECHGTCATPDGGTGGTCQ
jgi:hypothetical protein